MKQLDAISAWYDSLQARERQMVIATSIAIVVTLFYIMLWEPLHKGLQEEQRLHENNTNILAWMKQAAVEVRSLRASGIRATRKNSSSPVSLVLEQTVNTAGLKKNLSKLESSGKNSARVVLDGVAFNQLMLWLNTVEQNFGIKASSVNIEKTDKPGLANARLSFSRGE